MARGKAICPVQDSGSLAGGTLPTLPCLPPLGAIRGCMDRLAGTSSRTEPQTLASHWMGPWGSPGMLPAGGGTRTLWTPLKKSRHFLRAGGRRGKPALAEHPVSTPGRALHQAPAQGLTAQVWGAHGSDTNSTSPPSCKQLGHTRPSSPSPRGCLLTAAAPGPAAPGCLPPSPRYPSRKTFPH